MQCKGNPLSEEMRDVWKYAGLQLEMRNDRSTFRKRIVQRETARATLSILGALDKSNTP